MNYFEEKLIRAAKRHFDGLESGDLEDEAQGGMEDLAEVEKEIEQGKVKLRTKLGKQIWQWLKADQWTDEHYDAFLLLEKEFSEDKAQFQ
jgi:hypothetical protein